MQSDHNNKKKSKEQQVLMYPGQNQDHGWSSPVMEKVGLLTKRGQN